MNTHHPLPRVVVVGQGYVGLPLAMRAVEVGYDVVGFDTDHARVKRLCAAESYIEDVLSTTLSASLGTGRYRPSSDPASCDGFGVAIITVPTPLREGVPDLSYIESAAATLANHLRAGATVIVESTSYPGTTEELVGPLLEERTGLVAGTEFHLGYSPERIDPGNPTWRLVNTPKVVSGVTPASLEVVASFYATIVDTVVPVNGTREAELSKLLENTFRHVNIALVNEMAMFADDLGIDLWAAIDAAASKPFGFMKFTPGPGVGGHCLPIDPSYLSWRVRRALGHQFRFVELANDINEHMPDYVVRRLIFGLNDRSKALKGSKILLLGLAYKKNTGDARESPAAVVLNRLFDLGAQVYAADPYVVEEHIDRRVVRVDATAEEIASMDAVVLLTDHDAFDYQAVAEHGQYVLDTRRRIDGPAVDTL